MEVNKKKFELGQVVVTSGIYAKMSEDQIFGEFVSTSLLRHADADWGDLDTEDAALNEAALKSGEDRLFSSYKCSEVPDGRIWIITEWDRSHTTILLPSEY